MRRIEWLFENTVVRFFEWADYRPKRLLFGYFCIGTVAAGLDVLLTFIIGDFNTATALLGTIASVIYFIILARIVFLMISDQE